MEQERGGAQPRSSLAYAKTYGGLDAGAKPTRKSLKAGHRRADRTFGSARLGVHRAGLGGAEAVGPVARAHPDRASRRRRRQEGWSKIRERLDGAVELAKAAHPDAILYAGRNRLWLSRDGGRFWTSLALELPEIRAVELD